MLTEKLASQLSHLAAQDINVVSQNVIEIRPSVLEGLRMFSWCFFISSLLIEVVMANFFSPYDYTFDSPFIIFMLIAFLFANLPKVKPIRIDRRRQIIYWERYNALYIMRYSTYKKESYLPVHEKMNTTRVNGMIFKSLNLYLTLPHSESERTVSRMIGGDSREFSLKSFLYQFTNYEFDENDVLNLKRTLKEKRTLTLNNGVLAFVCGGVNKLIRFSLLSSLRYNEKALEQKIQIWFKKTK